MGSLGYYVPFMVVGGVWASIYTPFNPLDLASGTSSPAPSAILHTAAAPTSGRATPAIHPGDIAECGGRRRRTDLRLCRRGEVHRVRRRGFGPGPPTHGPLRFLRQRPSSGRPGGNPLSDAPREDPDRGRTQGRPPRPLPLSTLSQALPGLGSVVPGRRHRSHPLGGARQPARSRCRSGGRRGDGREEGRRLPGQARAPAPPGTHPPLSLALSARNGDPLPGRFRPPQGRPGKDPGLQDRHHRGIGGGLLESSNSPRWAS